MDALIGFMAFIAIALVGWLIAEAKYNTITFTHSAEEAEETEILDKERREHGFREMSIKDIIRTNSTKGFDAV